LILPRNKLLLLLTFACDAANGLIVTIYLRISSSNKGKTFGVSTRRHDGE
jgi:hypothetical protein